MISTYLTYNSLVGLLVVTLRILVTFIAAVTVWWHMSVATDTNGAQIGTDSQPLDNPDVRANLNRAAGEVKQTAEETGREVHRMGQMGAKRIGSLAIGIGVVGIVLNKMSDLDIVNNSTGVIDVDSIFQTAGSGLELLVVGVIIAAAAVLLSLWSGF